MPYTTKKPNGKWLCQIMRYGIKYSATGDTKQDAIFNANMKAREQKEKKEHITVEQAIENYIELKESVLSPSTTSGYRSIQKNCFKSISKTDISEITVPILQREVSELAKTNKPKTIRNRIIFLETVLKFHGIQLNTQGLTLPKNQKVIYQTPEPEQIRQILSAAQGTNIELPVYLAIWLGLRVSEIIALKWENITDNAITVTNAIVYADGKLHTKSTKSFEGARTLPLPEELKSMLKKHKAEQNKEGKRTEYIFPNLSGNAIGKRFTRLLEANNIPHCRFHDLRHANASIMMITGISDKYAMQRGGWATDRVYKNIYVQTFSEGESEAAEKVDSYIRTLLSQA